MSVSTVGDVIARMRTLASALPLDDGAAVFNSMYLRVTEAVDDQLRAGQVFQDNAFVTDLDVRFANLWFAAYDAARDKPKAWAPLFTARGSHDVLPIQFALAGMNAHIENDLPLAVVGTCAARNLTPANPVVRADYNRINDVLARVEADIRRSFLTDIEKSLSDRLEPVAHLISSWDIEKAREFAWLTAQALWELRRTRPLFDAYVGALGRTVGMGSRLLLTPLL